MTHVCYTTICSGRPFTTLFPCSSFKQTENLYGKASQDLAEQQQQCTLQTANMFQLGTLPNGVDKSSLVAFSEALTELKLDVQCTISDPAAMTSSLISTGSCSKHVLKRFASQYKPAASKAMKLTQHALSTATTDLCLPEFVQGMPSNATFESSCAPMELQTPAMPCTTYQVCSVPQSPTSL